MSDEPSGVCVAHIRLIALLSTTLALGVSACTSEETLTEPSISVSATRPYTAVDLGVPGENSEATDINTRGQIAGYAANQAVIWEDGTRKELGFLGGSECCSRAFAISPAGEVVGNASTASGVPHAFLWKRGVMKDLGTLGGDESVAFAINPAGIVVGQASSETANLAFLWKRGGMTTLGTLARTSVARDINPSGQVVGEARVAAGGTHAFLWKRGVLTDLGTLGGENSVAMAINAKGQVVGHSSTGPDEVHAFLWQRGTIRDLGLLGGVRLSFATDINAAGQVVGYFDLQGSGFQAFIWDRGMVTLLVTPPGGSSRAEGINNRGEVVGSTQFATGEIHATLWTR